MKTNGKIKVLLPLAVAVVSLLLVSYVPLVQTMSVAPDKINLNTQGNYESIQCIYGILLPSANITSHSVAVFFNGNYITQACEVHYCITDCNLFVEIDRNVFQNHPAVQALANKGMKPLTINGVFTVTNASGIPIIYNVDRLGYAEIIRPGNKN